MAEKKIAPRPRRTPAQGIRELLTEEGYRPQPVEGDDNPATVHFRVEGSPFLIRCAEDDPDFVHLGTGFSLDGLTQDELTLLRAANDLQNVVKVAKVQVPASRDYVAFELELLLGGKPLSAQLLERCIRTLCWLSRKFCERVTPRAPLALA